MEDQTELSNQQLGCPTLWLLSQCKTEPLFLHHKNLLSFLFGLLGSFFPKNAKNNYYTKLKYKTTKLQLKSTYMYTQHCCLTIFTEEFIMKNNRLTTGEEYHDFKICCFL